jgi:hypothetical protein
MGALFTALLCLEVLSGGAIFPNRPRRAAWPLPVVEHFMEWELLGIFIYHAAIAWFLVGVSLFWIDGNRVPKRFILAGLTVTVLPPLVWPGLRHFPFVLSLLFVAWLTVLSLTHSPLSPQISVANVLL